MYFNSCAQETKTLQQQKGYPCGLSALDFLLMPNAWSFVFRASRTYLQNQVLPSIAVCILSLMTLQNELTFPQTTRNIHTYITSHRALRITSHLARTHDLTVLDIRPLRQRNKNKKIKSLQRFVFCTTNQPRDGKWKICHHLRYIDRYLQYYW